MVSPEQTAAARPGPATPDTRRTRRPSAVLIGGVVSVVVGAGLFTRFGLLGSLGRDEAIYAYAAQRFAAGVPPYESIFDPKGPFATMFGGTAAATARLFGANELYAIRAAFCLSAVVAVLGAYLLVRRLWQSVLGGVAAAVVLATFAGFAQDALPGPDAKTPGVAASVLCMWLAARRNWFWAGVAASVAALTWQPLGPFAILLVIYAAFDRSGRRAWSAGLRALLGCLVPAGATALYLGLAGAWNDFVQSALVFPLTGVVRGNETMSTRIHRIFTVVRGTYGITGEVLLFGGALTVLVLAAARVFTRRHRGFRALLDPLPAFVVTCMISQFGYACFDFQGYPDVFPMLPFGAVGVGGAVATFPRLAARMSRRRWPATGLIAVAAALMTLLVGVSWVRFSNHPDNGHLRTQLSDACAVSRTLGKSGTLYALGDPTSLVLTRRANPDRFIYLGSGISDWKIKHTAGGLAGWLNDIEGTNPGVITVSGWSSPYRAKVVQLLRDYGFQIRHAGTWFLLVSNAAIADAQRAGVALTVTPTPVATDLTGHRLPARFCG